MSTSILDKVKSGEVNATYFFNTTMQLIRAYREQDETFYQDICQEIIDFLKFQEYDEQVIEFIEFLKNDKNQIIGMRE